MSHLIDGEIEMISQHISPNSVVVDVGAMEGEWSANVFSIVCDAQIHAFEPTPVSYDVLNKLMSIAIENRRLITNCLAVSSISDDANTFWVYEDWMGMCTLHRRDDKEMQRVGVGRPICTRVKTISLDAYCRNNEIEHIDFLKIDTEGNEWAVLDGARELLDKGAIKTIQFEYGGCYLDAGTTLEMIFDILIPCGFKIGKVNSQKIQFYDRYIPELETYDFCNYIAVMK